MKLRYLLCMLLSLGYINSANLCTQAQCGKVVDGSCRCYCSAKCGPRSIKPSIDNPVFSKGKCFCQNWDMNNYEYNGCDKK